MKEPPFLVFESTCKLIVIYRWPSGPRLIQNLFFPGCRLQDEADTVRSRVKVEHSNAHELVRERNLQLEILLAEANQVYRVLVTLFILSMTLPQFPMIAPSHI